MVLIWLLNGMAVGAQTEGLETAAPPNEDSEAFWRKRARYYQRNPLVLKSREQALYERQAIWKRKYELLAGAYGQARHDNDSTQTELRLRLRLTEDSLHDCRREADSLRFRLTYVFDSLRLAMLSQRGGGPSAEPVYVVQIGSIARKQRRNRLPQELYMFSIDSTSQYNKYLVGRCSSLDEAKALEAELKALGLRDAFVAAYQNGERINPRKVPKNTSPAPQTTPQPKTQPAAPRPPAPPSAPTPADSNAAAEVVVAQPSEKPIGWQAENGKLNYGFRVQVYSGTENGAQQVRQQVESLKLEQPAYVVFEKPHYKVRVGDFRNFREAEAMLERLKKHYSDAYILNDIVE